jgi:hypothetical protein
MTKQSTKVNIEDLLTKKINSRVQVKCDHQEFRKGLQIDCKSTA